MRYILLYIVYKKEGRVMTDCNQCIHANDRCYCPPRYECKAFIKKTEKVRRIFEFQTSDNWVPNYEGCWVECPFSPLISLGETCKWVKEFRSCPFVNNSRIIQE